MSGARPGERTGPKSPAGSRRPAAGDLRRPRQPSRDSRAALRALRKGAVLVVWRLDRLGRNLAHLVNTVQDLSARGVGLRVLAGPRGRRSIPGPRPAASCSAAMAHCDTSVSALCRDLGIRPVTLYRYVGRQGQLREQGKKVLGLSVGWISPPPGNDPLQADRASASA